MAIDVQDNWDFVPSRVPFWLTKVRLRASIRRRRPPPRSRTLKPAFDAPRWTVYFIYLPDGHLLPSHRFTLAGLKQLDRKLLVVCAAPSPEMVPAELLGLADAVSWKSLAGFDFSAYSLALRMIARASPHADVFVLNDSVFGPFGDLAGLLERAPWDLTGFSSSPQFENHIQSYAFLIRDLTEARLRHLSAIFPRWFAYNDIFTVVSCLETRFARLAFRKMTVGAFWHGPDDGTDPTVKHGLELLNLGLPFLKRSLVGKHREVGDERDVRDALERWGHPRPD